MTALKRSSLIVVGLTLSVAALLWSVTARAERAAPRSRPAEVRADGPLTLGFAGAASCSARACHGSDKPVAGSSVQQNEFTMVAMHDKHARAYTLLTQDRAKGIAENLAASNPEGKPIEAHKDWRCLACHATPQSAWELYEGKDPTTLEKTIENWHVGGVSCEACHGPADRGKDAWLLTHMNKTWKDSSAADKTRYGFNNMSDLVIQAQTCAGCHVGAPADKAKNLPPRDCNHDIMAAGHPRLNFELALFRANMPPHWNVAKKKQDDPGYQAKVWAVGRLACAEASLKLMEFRANEAKVTGRWPEFAEGRCFACHKDLDPGWSEKKEPVGRKTGSFPYDNWNWVGLPQLFPDLKTSHEELTGMMGAMRRGSAPLDSLIDLSRMTREKVLSPQLAALNRKDAKEFNPSEFLTKLKSESAPLTWEEATQFALAIAALKKDAVGSQNFADLWKLLAFPEMSASPAGLQGPAAKEADIRKALDALMK